jgi:hypothetical protein
MLRMIIAFLLLSFCSTTGWLLGHPDLGQHLGLAVMLGYYVPGLVARRY